MEKKTKAAALRYDSEQEAVPRVLAKGRHAVAEAIIQKAEEHGIALFENKELVEALLHYELNTQIEPELYESVAKVLAWLAEIDSGYRSES